ncbi:hypothetical protein SLEP1_g27243 [Rubroshorea leprosula]|uniref:Peptidase A1 domain-containing protein n=1 Tax=Rubroshorea leprosula TaxID=152421 RepID=A0AAV5JPX3_9ROSI|nr:hypothetical protein SLEP1_g27243 [Rubroshorea leprosula]
MVPYRILLAGVILPLAIVLGEFPTSFKLERTIPSSQRLNLSQLIARDAARHRRLLTSSGGIVNFSLNGDLTAGLYYTKVFLGSPPQEFHVLIDTGSYISWVSCKSCHDCPRKSEFPFQLNFFDPGSSSTASLVSCSDQRCNSSLQSSDFICESNSNQCHYNITYVDGSGTIGYYVSDLLQFDTALKGSVTTNSTGTITFGCSVFQSGGLTESNGAVDGIFGFGQQNLSIISQLASKGIAPNVFSHCLKGDNSGGGILVLGKIVEPNIVYTSLVPSQPYYNINLQSISVNGRKLAIDPSVFATSNNSGTIVDSGTTLVVLAETAYDVVIDSNGVATWCLGFGKIPGSEQTILGDVILQDKIVIYDLDNQTVGWVNYDCSQSVNVLTINGTLISVQAEQPNNNNSPPSPSYSYFVSIIMLVIVL